MKKFFKTGKGTMKGLLNSGLMTIAVLAGLFFAGCAGSGSDTGPQDTVATPEISPGSGVYTSAQSVTITCATEGAVIRYTTDGSDPGETEGTVYTSAVTVSTDCEVRAIAVKSGMSDSQIAAASYEFGEPAGPVISSMEAGAHQATVTWEAVSGAVGYDLYYAQGTTVTAAGGTKIADATSPYTVTGLKGGKTYAFMIVARYSSGEELAGAVRTAVPLPTWAAKGGAGFSAGAAAYISLALDSNDNPYVAYMDYASDDKATVMKFNGTGWETVGGAGFSEGSAYNCALALDSSDVPYVAYTDGANSYGATVMKFNGTGWEAVGGAGFSPGSAGNISLALDSSDIPCVAFLDSTSGYKASVMKYSTTNGAWEAVGSPGFTNDQAFSVSLALDSNGVPYVAFTDYEFCAYSGTYEVMASVMRYNGTGWEAVGGVGFSEGSAGNISLALDSSDAPCVAYVDDAWGYAATVMRYNGTGWEAVGNAGFSEGEISNISLALDPSGAPCVAYVDYAHENKATVMRYGGTGWEAVGGAGFSEGEASHPSLALDSNGSPYMAYIDDAHENRATVMFYE